MDRLLEIEKRLSEIKDELSLETSDIDALEKEVEELQEERKGIKDKIEKRNQTTERIAGLDLPGRKFTEGRSMEKTFTASSPEYRSAYLKNLLGGEMSVEERAAFTHTTANTTQPLPTTMLNQIWDLVSKKHVIMGDITIYRTGTIIEVVKHTAIAAGKAAVVAQGAANADDEQNTFVKVTLSGKDFSKHVVLSYAFGLMSIDALEQYLINEISANIGEALADDCVASIESGTASGNKVTTATVKEIKFKELAALFALLKNVSTRTVYVNNATFYNYLVSMVDTTGRPIFQPTAQAGAEGVLLGALVKIEESVGDNKILVGDPKMVVCNMVQDIMIENDKDIKTHTHIYAGYARAESALLNDTSFAVLTVKQS